MRKTYNLKYQKLNYFNKTIKNWLNLILYSLSAIKRLVS
jgi:hypothetical protein